MILKKTSAGLMLVSLLFAHGAQAQLFPNTNNSQDYRIQVPGIFDGPSRSIGGTLADTLKADGFVKIDSMLIDAKFVRGFYQERAFAPVFTDANGLTPIGTTVQSIINQDAADNGLDPKFYLNQSTIDSRVPVAGAALSARQGLELELLMAKAFLDYANDLFRGRVIPGKDKGFGLDDIDPNVKIGSFSKEYYTYLNSIVAKPSIVRSGINQLAPQAKQYRSAMALLKQLNDAKRQGGWAPLRALQTNIRPGVTDYNIPLIRMRLADMGLMDLDRRNDKNNQYDAALQQAVMNFQDDHKTQRDGVIGQNTFNALSISLDQRITQVRANLERMRLMPHDFGDRYILVDLGRQEFELREGGELKLAMNVVVGQEVRRTPTMINHATDVILNPYWHAPDSIAVKDIIPAILSNPSYLNDARMKIIDQRTGQEMSWDEAYGWLMQNNIPIPFPASTKIPALPFMFRQEPGPMNSLGVIRFNLNNPYSIYMHDTAHRDGFKNLKRNNSSGCIRLEKPLSLGEYLLGDQGFTMDKIRQITTPTSNMMGAGIPEGPAQAMFGPDDDDNHNYSGGGFFENLFGGGDRRPPPPRPPRGMWSPGGGGGVMSSTDEYSVQPEWRAKTIKLSQAKQIKVYVIGYTLSFKDPNPFVPETNILGQKVRDSKIVFTDANRPRFVPDAYQEDGRIIEAMNAVR